MSERQVESAAGKLPLTRGKRLSSRIKHLLENWFFKTFLPGLLIRKKYLAFQRLLKGDRRALELISGLEEIRQKKAACDIEYIRHALELLDKESEALVEALVAFNPIKYALLRNYRMKYAFYAHMALAEKEPDTGPPYTAVLDLELPEELAGGKAVELSFLKRNHDLPVPPGLIITTRSYNLMLQENGLFPLIREQLSRLGPRDHDSIYQAGRRLQEMIMEARIPAELEKQTEEAFEKLDIENSRLALRSSAVGEDLQASFAGQFESIMNVSPKNWSYAYKQVAASKYSPHALYYRIMQGFTDSMTPMAVLVMPMVKAVVSGILYTEDQNMPGRSSAYLVSGTGEKLAEGYRHQAAAGFDKKTRDLYRPETDIPVCAGTLEKVFETGLELERIFGAPQDVEWVADENEKVFILQSRPLRMSRPEETREPGKDHFPESSVIMRGKWVSSGRASGKVYRLRNLKSLDQVPENSMIVTKELPPELTLVIDRASAVIAEKGTPACHFASVAREAGLPVICQVREAGSLEEGRTVSIDSDKAEVLSGMFFENTGRKPRSEKPDSPVQEKLEQALRHISPLTLPDQESGDFVIESCRSIHDIVRYVHESGVREMFSLVGRRGIDSHGAKRLLSGLPLVMHVLDVHQGLTAEGKSKKEVKLEHVKSLPMQRLFSGLSSPAVKWNQDVLHYDWDAYAKSTASLADVEKSTLFSSYAIIDRQYLHALLRFGYHFAVVDAVISGEAQHNYIHFSFKGGGGNPEQRFLRVELIREILEGFGFSVHTTADLLEAGYDRRSFDETAVNMSRLGVVLGKTVLLDMRLKDSGEIGSIAESTSLEINDIFQQK